MCNLNVCIALGLLEDIQCWLQSSINNAVCSVQLDTILLHGAENLEDDIACSIIETAWAPSFLTGLWCLGLAMA